MADPTKKKKNRFVQPDIARLDLSDSDWVEVKERLTYAEHQRLYSSMLRTVKEGGGDGEIGVDLGRFNLLRLETWLVDWSFRDANDKPVPLTRAAIENLDPDTVREIDEALDRHQTDLAAKKVLESAGTS